MTSGPWVDFTLDLIALTRVFCLSISTPASRYVKDMDTPNFLPTI